MAVADPFVFAQRNVLSNQVADSIRAAIRSGALRPGTRLIERDIALRMGVSQAPVREALRALEAEGLVTTAAHRGSFVTKLSPADVLDLFRIRSSLERLAVELLVDHMTAPVFAELRSTVDAMDAAEANQEHSRVSELDYCFHELVVRHAGSERLKRLWTSMHGLIRMLVAETDLQAAKAPAAAARHGAILDAIASGDRKAAQDMMESHVRDAGSHLAASLGE